jgi:hypothetical protein
MRILILILLTGSTLAIFNLPEGKPDSEITHQYMLEQLHLGNYDSIPAILKQLSELEKEDAEDPLVNADLGFVYLWQFSERGRKPQTGGIEKTVYLSNHYFKRAVKYNPADARLKGFQSATEICEGALNKNVSMIFTGYLNAFDAVKEWPQFNKFALSLVSSQLNKNSFLFRLAVKYQWELLDDCSCKELDRTKVMRDPKRTFLSLVDELKNSNDKMIKRACWNTMIAPHNYEGFLLNFGDMLVKEGKPEDAFEIYSAARLSPSYKEWPYASVLEQRIKNIESNRRLFNKRPDLSAVSDDRQIFINSTFSCTGCHQMSKKEFARSVLIMNSVN